MHFRMSEMSHALLSILLPSSIRDEPAPRVPTKKWTPVDQTPWASNSMGER
jgi:hypothetical protein